MSVTTLTSLERPHYNLRQTLLQFAYINKYYKMLQPLLQIAQVGFITKCCTRYYTMRKLLQNAAIVITKCVVITKCRRTLREKISHQPKWKFQRQQVIVFFTRQNCQTTLRKRDRVQGKMNA